MTPEKNSSIRKEVNKAKSKVAKNFFQVGLATSMILGAPACVPTEATSIITTGETNPLPGDFTKTAESPTEATYEVTSTPGIESTIHPPTEEATETAPSGLIKIDMDNIIYPPVGYVKEYFEKGEYDAGVETIKQWVGVWEKMGVFEELEIENNSLSPVPLDGRARLVCVRVNEETPLLCPSLDLINGGLKAVPEEGNWDETDMPLMVTLERLEELISRGSETDMAYQFIDKYQKSSIKYIDPKTGQMVEGEYQVPGGEIKLPEIVPESMNQIEELRFNMEFKDPKAAYRMLLERVVGSNLENQQFWQETLGISNPTVDQLLSYARNNVGGPENKAYWLPFNTNNGTKFNFLSWWGNRSDVRSLSPGLDGVYLDGIYSMFFYSGDLKDLVKADFIKGIVNDNKKVSMGLRNLCLDGISGEEFGLLFFDNRFIYISGNEGLVGDPNYNDYLLGGKEKMFRKDRDPAIISAQFLSYIKGLTAFDPDKANSGGLICTYGNSSDCPGGVLSDSLKPEDWVVKIKK